MSKKLSDAETRYPTHEQELLAIIVALKEWRHYVHGNKFRVITDHHSLKWIKSQPRLSRRQARWSEFLQEFEFDIEYKSGKQNVVADALSRHPDHEANAIEVSRLAVQPRLLESIKSSYNIDPACAEILKSNGTKAFQVKDGLIWKKQRLYIPDDMKIRTELLSECHDAAISGHLGVHKTLQRVAKRFYWPNLQHTVREYVSSCQACQHNKPSNQQPMGLLQPLPIPERRWDVVTMDMIGPLPVTKNGYDTIVVFVDKLTKMVHYAPTVQTVDAPQLAKIFMNTIVKLHGVPKVIISDRGTQFNSNFWKSLWSALGTKIAMTTAYHPQADGQTERANRVLLDMLRSYVDIKHNDWDEKLAMAEFAVNSSVHASTGFTPFHLNYGQDPLMPLDLLIEADMSNPAAEDMLQKMKSDIEAAKDNLIKAQIIQEKYANESRRDVEFKVGEKVLLSTKNFKPSATLKKALPDQKKKLRPKYIGPFEITRIISKVNVEIKLPNTLKIHPVFHVSQIKKYIENDSFPDREVVAPPPIDVGDAEPEYEVERILDKWISKPRGKNKQIDTYYLVKWKGYPDYESTWQHEDELKNAKKAIKAFEQGTKMSDIESDEE